jgi:5-methylcytosine-specific restriction endonuclease McrA
MYLVNKDHINKINQKWKNENRDKHRSINKKWKENNKERCKVVNKIFYLNNTEKLKISRREWYERNKEDKLRKNNEWIIAHPDKVKLYRKKSYKKQQSTVEGKLNSSIGGGIWHSIKHQKGGRKWEDLVGYNVNDLKIHLEKLFLPGMTWDNYGKSWEIDHKVPKSLFKYSTPNDKGFKFIWSLSNLQPLWKTINRRKYNKLNYEYMEMSNG